MSIDGHLQGINDEVKAMVDSQFEVSVVTTSSVPNIDSGSLTYPNFTNSKLQALEIETCVLFIDIRKSTEISSSHRRPTLAKLYSAFVRAMVQAAEYYGGKVRNIIGDRVMVVFDEKDCYENAVKTAFSLNTVSSYIINNHFKHNEIKCGIGIDYGKLLVVKTGTIKRGFENREYKGLVWLGDACNIASKLTDQANKEIVKTSFEIQYMDNISFLSDILYPPTGLLAMFAQNSKKEEGPVLRKIIVTEKEFLRNVRDSTSGVSYSFYGDIRELKKKERKFSTSPILVSERVYDGYRKSCPEADSIKNKWWTLQDLNSADIKIKVYGCGVFYTAGKNLK